MKRLFALAGVALVAPLFMSRRWRIFRSTWVHASAEEIFPFLANPEIWPEWAWPEGTLGMAAEGPESGSGATLHWVDKFGGGRLRLTSCRENNHVGYEIELNGGRLRIEGLLSLVPLGDTTRVLWTAWWVGDPNPYFRYVDIALRLRLGCLFSQGLRNLKLIVESRDGADPFDPADSDAQWNVS